MKKFLTSRIFAFILGAVIFGGITAVSAYTLFASQIKYTPSDNTWKKANGEDIINVSDAVDELYIKANTPKVATQVATLTTQGASYTMQNDGYIIGTMQSERGASGEIYFDDVTIYELVGASGVYGRDYSVSLYAPSGTVVSTTNYGTYNLTVYEWK